MKLITVLSMAGVANAAFAPNTSSTTFSRTQLNERVASGKMAEVRKQINGLSKDNFDATLKELEPVLTLVGNSFYKKSMNRIAVKAKSLGTDVPAGYAAEAKATEKRREKKAAYVAAKAEEEAAAAAEEEPPAEE